MASAIQSVGHLYALVVNKEQEVRNLKWSLMPGESDFDTWLTMNRPEVGLFREALDQLINPSQEPIFYQKIEEKLKKIEKKMASIEETVDVEKEAIDPRVAKTYQKIQRAQANPLSFAKMEKYRNCLSHIGKECNEATKGQIIEARALLDNAAIASLKTKPETRGCLLWRNDLYRNYPGDLAMTNACLKAGDEQTIYEYLKWMLQKTGENKLVLCNGEFITHLFTMGHYRALVSHEHCQSLTAIHEDLFFSEIKFDGLNLQSPKELSKEKMVSILEAILHAKKTNQHENVAVLIRFGDHHLVVSCDKSNTLYLLNPLGDEGSSGYPYVSAFGALDTAAGSLSRILADKTKEHSFSGTIAITAFCQTENSGLDSKEYHRFVPSLEHLLSYPESEHFRFPARPYYPFVHAPQEVERAIGLLLHLNQDGYYFPLSASDRLDSIHVFNSPINGDRQIKIKERVLLHQCQIERSSPSTSEGSHRGMQRVQVEVLLWMLGSCLKCLEGPENNLKVKASLSLVFKTLEKLKLDQRDLPAGKENLAHLLFEKLYYTYLEAWKQNQTMVHPHDGCFNGDFGRNAFVGEVQDKIESTHKIKAVEEVAKALKEVWGL